MRHIHIIVSLNCQYILFFCMHFVKKKSVFNRGDEYNLTCCLPYFKEKHMSSKILVKNSQPCILKGHMSCNLLALFSWQIIICTFLKPQNEYIISRLSEYNCREESIKICLYDAWTIVCVMYCLLDLSHYNECL
jgi:hypothetical protein